MVARAESAVVRYGQAVRQISDLFNRDIVSGSRLRRVFSPGKWRIRQDLAATHCYLGSGTHGSRLVDGYVSPMWF